LAIALGLVCGLLVVPGSAFAAAPLMISNSPTTAVANGCTFTAIAAAQNVSASDIVAWTA
jgi:hypothetical protein